MNWLLSLIESEMVYGFDWICGSGLKRVTRIGCYDGGFVIIEKRRLGLYGMGVQSEFVYQLIYGRTGDVSDYDNLKSVVW